MASSDQRFPVTGKIPRMAGFGSGGFVNYSTKMFMNKNIVSLCQTHHCNYAKPSVAMR